MSILANIELIIYFWRGVDETIRGSDGFHL